MQPGRLPRRRSSLLSCDGGFSLLREGRYSFEADSDFEDVAEPRSLALSGPDLQLTLTCAGSHKSHVSVFDFASHVIYELPMGSIETVGYLEYRSQAKHRAAVPAVERIVLFVLAAGSCVVRFPRERAAMISYNRGQHTDLITGETRHFRVLYEVQPMTVMVVVGYVKANVVKNPGVLQQLALMEEI